MLFICHLTLCIDSMLLFLIVVVMITLLISLSLSPADVYLSRSLSPSILLCLSPSLTLFLSLPFPSFSPHGHPSKSPCSGHVMRASHIYWLQGNSRSPSIDQHVPAIYLQLHSGYFHNQWADSTELWKMTANMAKMC